MKPNYVAFSRALVFCGLLALPLSAQDAPPTSEDTGALVTSEQENAGQDLLDLPREDLAELLSESSDAEIDDLISDLSEDDLQNLIEALAQDPAESDLLGKIVARIIENDPAATDTVIEAVSANAGAGVLPEIATNLFDKIEGRCGGYEQAAMTGLTLAALSFSTATAERFVVLGNERGGDCAAAMSVALAEITETASNLIASSVETALALEGGAMLQLVSLARGEDDVAAIPADGAPVAAPAGPFVAPGAIGGGGATAGGGAPGISAVASNRTDSVTGAGGGTFTPLGTGGGSVSPAD